MPRGRRRGRRARRNVRSTRRSVSPKQQNIEKIAEPNKHRQTLVNNSLCSNKKHDQTFPKLKIASVCRSAKADKTSTDLDDIQVEIKSNNQENCVNFKLFTSQSCLDNINLCRCLARSLEDQANSPVTSKQDLLSKITNVPSKKDSQKFPKFSIIKKKKTPYGKVEIFATGKLEKAEEERVAMEAIKLLKYVKGIKEQEKRCKASKTEQGGLTARIRNLFGK